MLQGPHGPFFDRLATRLRRSGAAVWRVAFNAGDAFFWSDRASVIAHRGSGADWPAHLAQIIADKRVTDIVLYGDVRPIHAAAVRAAQAQGLRLHVFEEGYLRPYWISYERGGANGHSALMAMGTAEMTEVLHDVGNVQAQPPAHWGDMRQHKFYGALYHFLVLLARRRWPGWTSHRKIGIMQEFRLSFRRLLLTPELALLSWSKSRTIRCNGFDYALVLMQLEHDANFQTHSDFDSNAAFIAQVVRDFAAAAPAEQHLVFKAHPLEDGRAGNGWAIAQAARALGLEDRVHYIPGGKLAQLVSQARAVVTVNSTAAQQALWRGLPVKALGRAVYDKPGLTSSQTLTEFLADPQPPEAAAYAVYRDYLLQTSQLPGGYYARRARRRALLLLPALMLAEGDPYQELAARQHHQMKAENAGGQGRLQALTCPPNAQARESDRTGERRQ